MLGPSGSGKTTCLRIIAGFERPDAGRVALAGRDVTDLPPHERDVNTVFQDYALFPHMSVGENVGYGLKVKKVGGDERRRRVGEALEMVQLGGYEQRRRSLGRSASTRRARPGFGQPAARAAAGRAAGGARPELRQQVQQELRSPPAGGARDVRLRHARPGGGAHDERPAVFNDGRVEQVGAPADVYEREQRVRGRLRGGVEHRRARWPPLHDPAREGAHPRGRRGRVRRPARRGRPRPRRGLHRRRHALRGGPGRRRRDPGGQAEPRDVLTAGARAAGTEVRVAWHGEHAYSIPTASNNQRRGSEGTRLAMVVGTSRAHARAGRADGRGLRRDDDDDDGEVAGAAARRRPSWARTRVRST